MRRFFEVIEELSLKDLPSSDGQFTLYSGLNSQAASRLDRFLVSNEWICPISLEGGEVKKGKTPFRFENMWLLLDGFK